MPIRIELPVPRNLTKIEQYRLLSAVAEPDPQLRVKRAALATELDDFSAAIADLEAIPVDAATAGQLYWLARAKRKVGEVEAGLAAIKKIDVGALNQEFRHAVLVEQAGLLRAADRRDEAVAHLRGVLRKDPSNDSALRKLVAILFDLGHPQEALDLADSLLAKGIITTRILATKAAGLAALGEPDEAQDVRGFTRFFREQNLADLGDLNARVVDELRRHPALRFGNSGQASEGSWRIDELSVRQMPAVNELLERIARQVSSYSDEMLASGSDSHPWLASLPENARIAAWAIIAPAEGRETWHVHDKGRISGVYYLAVPDGLGGSNDPAGAIEFGWTDRLLDDETRAKLPAHIHHPREGDLLLFPSHIHHRTWPHGKDEDRICIAFDLVPAD